MEVKKNECIRVLLADSSWQHLQMLEGYLRLSGEGMQCCGSYCTGAQLLTDLAAGLEVDLILTDYFLRDMDAAELCRRIRDLRPAVLPQILCAIEAQNEWQKASLLSLGLKCYMIKPYHMENLFSQARFLCGAAPAPDARDRQIHRLLACCGLTEHRRAPYIYTVRALHCVLEQFQAHPLAKEVYHAVAQHEMVTASAVESAVRRAAAQAFQVGTESYRTLCRRAGAPTDQPLSNGAFLELLAWELQSRAGEQ